MTDMDMNEMLAAISKVCVDARPIEPDDPGATRDEQAAYWKVSPQEAGRRLTKAVRLGVLIRGYRYAQNANGTWRKVPVYRPAWPDGQRLPG